MDGKAAAEYAWNNPDPERRKVGYSGTWAIAAWAQSDPASAFDYMEAQEDRGKAAKMHQGFMTGYARADLMEARDYAASLEKGKMRGAAVETLLKEHMKQVGASGTLSWAADTLRSGGDPDYIKFVMGKATMAASRDEHGRLLARFVDQYRDSDYVTSQMFEEAADEWAESDPHAAVAWLEKHFDDKRVTSKVVDGVADEWAKTDPVRASAWIESQLDNPLVNDKVTGRAAGEWAVNDPLGAADWVASLPEKMQAKSNWYVARQWPNDRLDEAISRVDGNRSPSLDTARESIADRIDGRNPEEAIRLSNSITDPKVRERSLVRSAQSMYRWKKDAVLAWLPVSGLSPAAQQQVVRKKK